MELRAVLEGLNAFPTERILIEADSKIGRQHLHQLAQKEEERNEYGLRTRQTQSEFLLSKPQSGTVK